MAAVAEAPTEETVTAEVETGNGDLVKPTDAKAAAEAQAGAEAASKDEAASSESATANADLVMPTDTGAVAEADSTASKPEDKEDAADKVPEPKDEHDSKAKDDNYKPVSAHDRHNRNGDRDRNRDRDRDRDQDGDRGGGRGSFRGRGNHRSQNIKTRFEEQPESNDPDEIRRQVEFYFSDSNLPIDAHLLELTGGHNNKPVALKEIHNFKRMRHFQPYSAVRSAVAESDFLNLNDDDEITRKQPLSDKFTDDPAENRAMVHTSSMFRSIYAKGFGDETVTTHLDIEAFFAPYGPTRSVRLRRQDDGRFKGSVFVEFEDEEQQRQFLELDSKPKWQGEKELEVMSKQEYVDLKHQGIIEGTVKPRSPTGRHSFNNTRRRGSKEWVDKDDWKARRDRDNRDDRRGGSRGGRGGRGNKRGGRGGGGRGGYRDRDDERPRRRRSRSPDDRDDSLRKGSKEEEPPSRAEAEAAREKGVEVADVAVGAEAPAEARGKASAEKEMNGEGGAKAGAEALAESKKRGREDGDGAEAGQGEAKKVKEAVAGGTEEA